LAFILGTIISFIVLSDNSQHTDQSELTKQFLEEKKQIIEEKKILEARVNKLEDKVRKLEEELKIAKPNPVPIFKEGDLLKREIMLRRVFSVKSGNCFETNGDSSCFYCKVKTRGEGFGYIIYKANRVFRKSNDLPEIYDATGNKLNLLTQDSAKLIINWEKQNPNASIGLSVY